MTGAMALGEALVKAWGPQMAAENIIPVLAPALTAPNLSREQFHMALRYFMRP